MEYFVNKIEDESEKFAKKIHLIKFLSKIRDEFDNTLLHHAAYEGKLNCLKILIGCKVIVNERKTDDEQTSCLFMCKNGQTKCANTIFEKNVSVNVYNLQRQTPLHLAAYGGYQESLELLIRKGGDVNAKDEDDRTPIHYAVFLGKVDCLEVLLANGADVNARTNTLYTPLHIIGYSPEGSKEEKKRCAEMLIAAGADISAKDEDGDTIFFYQFFQDLKVERPDLFTQN
jgi:ankyrin repeat protein